MNTTRNVQQSSVVKGSVRIGIAPIVLLVGSMTVGVILAEVVLRTFGFSYGNTHMESSSVLHHVHVSDHRFISYHSSQEYGGHLVYYDNDGLRASPEATTKEEGTPTFVVAFLGDSFVEALQVSHEESFVGRLEAAAPSGVSTRNYGTSSYGPLLYLLQWKTQIRNVKPTHVFLMLYGNDIRNDEAMARIATYDHTGTVVSVPGPKQTWGATLARKFHLLRLMNMVRLQLLWVWEHRDETSETPVAAFIEENPNINELTGRYLRQLVAEIRASGAALVLMAVPSKERTLRSKLRTNEPSFATKVQKWATDHTIPYVDLSSAFYAAADDKIQVFFDRDIHFTTEGHKIVADVLTVACPKLFSQEPQTENCVAR